MAIKAARDAAVKPGAPKVTAPPLEVAGGAATPVADAVGADLASLVSGLRVDVDASILKYAKGLESLLAQCGSWPVPAFDAAVVEQSDLLLLIGSNVGVDLQDEAATDSEGGASILGEPCEDGLKAPAAEPGGGDDMINEHSLATPLAMLAKGFREEEEEREKASRLQTQRKSVMVSQEEADAATNLFNARSQRQMWTWRPCRTVVKDLVSKKKFDIFFCILILSNTLIFGIEAEYLANTRQLDAPIGFKVISLLYTIAFLFELLLRLFAFGREFFSSADRGWNFFDASIVGLSVVELVVFAMESMGGSTLAEADQLVYMRMLRIARTVRVLRVVRIISFFRSLRLLLLSVMNTMRSLFWTVMLLLMILYVFGVMFTQAATQHLALDSYAIDGLSRYYGTLYQSVYTLFKSITNGIDWEVAVDPLVELGWTWSSLFVVYIAFTYFAVLNVVTGVFCQTAIESAVKDQDEVMQTVQDRKKAYIGQLTSLFNDVDTNGSGDLTIDEFETLLGDERLQKYCASLDITLDDAWALFKLLDKDGSGEICVNEFVTGCLRLQGAARSVDLALAGYQLDWLINRLVQFFKYSDEQFRDLRSMVEPCKAPPSPSKAPKGCSAAAFGNALSPLPIHLLRKLGKHGKSGERFGSSDAAAGAGPGFAGWDPSSWITPS